MRFSQLVDLIDEAGLTIDLDCVWFDPNYDAIISNGSYIEVYETKSMLAERDVNDLADRIVNSYPNWIAKDDPREAQLKDFIDKMNDLGKSLEDAGFERDDELVTYANIQEWMRPDDWWRECAR